MTAVGIDVSKGKSTVAIRRPGGEIVRKPFDVRHDRAGLQQLVQILQDIGGEIRIVMEHTGMYWRPVASVLLQAGFFVSVVNAILTHQFSDNSLRKVKTDKADSLKLANYALAYWAELKRYDHEDETRQQLKFQSRLYQRTVQTSTALRNGLISLLDQTFPNANQFFPSSPPTKDGHHKWIDFVERFWHKDCVAALSLRSFAITLEKWCKRTGYRYSYSDAEYIHAQARNAVATLPKNDSTKLLMMQAVHTLNTVYESLHIIRTEMLRLASMLPEYQVVMAMKGAGPVTGPQLMAEIGDVRRFTHKGALVAFAGVDAPPFQSGDFEAKSRHVSKRGSSRLRRTLFLICGMILCRADPEDPVFCFMDRKRAEGKHFYVYMVAGAAKFLRIYYARVKQCMNQLDEALVSPLPN
ncbi:MAG: IS110 family transposase [Clostridia bacterium]|nr:IS110 family transposase [Clostridia bacterium]